MAITRLTQSTLQQAFPKFPNAWDGVSAVPGMDSIGSVAINTSSSNTITIANIPQTYSSLYLTLMGSTQATGGAGYVSFYISFNADATSANYRSHAMSGDGSAASSFPVSGSVLGIRILDFVNSTVTSNAQPVIIDIYDYANTNKNKSIKLISGYSTNNAAVTYPQTLFLAGGIWESNSAITSLTITTSGSNFSIGTVASLYGVK